MADKKINYTFSIGGVKQASTDVSILKENLSALDKFIITSKFQNKLTESFRNYSDISLAFSNYSDLFTQAINKTLPPFNLALETIKEMSNFMKLDSLKLQIKELEDLANKKRNQDIKYTQEAKTIHETYYSLMSKLYKEDSSKFEKLQTEKKAYLSKYNAHQQAAEIAMSIVQKKRTDKLAEDKAIADIKYTEKSKKTYNTYYAHLEEKYKNDGAKLQKVIKEKLDYNKEYDEYNKTSISANILLEKSLEDQIKKIKELATSKYSADYEFTEDSKLIHENLFALREKKYEKDATLLKETLDRKTKYQEDYDSRSKTIQKIVDDSKTIVEKEKIKDLIKELKEVGDLKKDANLQEIITQKLFIKEEEDLRKARTERITELEKTAIEHHTQSVLGHNSIQLDSTKENYNKIKQLRIENIEAAKKEKKNLIKYYDEMASHFEKGSKGETLVLEEKNKKIRAINEETKKEQEEIEKLANTNHKANVARLEEWATKLKEFQTKWGERYDIIADATKKWIDEDIATNKERQAEITKLIAEETKAYQTHSSKVKELQEEEKTATGGRLLVIQEQLTREVEAQKVADDALKESNEKKKEIEKDIERREKQKKKIDKIKSIAEATIGQATAIMKAYSTGGPILGSIFAAIVTAATIPIVSKIKREWDKLEDGGLLNGKRHSQGGMRIEGTNIEVEGDEYVVNRISTRKNLGLIDYINNQRRELSPADLSTYFNRNGQSNAMQTHTIKHMYEAGGQLTNLEVIDATTAPDSNSILDAISRINFRPVVSVVDITNTQNSITEIKDIAGA